MNKRIFFVENGITWQPQEFIYFIGTSKAAWRYIINATTNFA
jgi:hypothetical protein